MTKDDVIEKVVPLTDEQFARLRRSFMLSSAIRNRLKELAKELVNESVLSEEAVWNEVATLLGFESLHVIHGTTEIDWIGRRVLLLNSRKEKP